MIENRDAGEQRNLSAASAGATELSHASHHPVRRRHIDAGLDMTC
jgi:hypothetical protein